MRDRLRLGHVWYLKGNLTAARECYAAVARATPECLPAWIAWGLTLLRADRREQAAEVYREALGHHGGDLGLQSHLERALQQHAPLPPAGPAGPGPHVALYSDCSGYGAGEINHALMMSWRRAGYRVTSVQPAARDPRARQRLEAGIAHCWLPEDDLYDLRQTPLAFSNASEAEQLLIGLRPDLVVFGDGAPVSNLAAKEAASRLGLPAMAIVHCVQSQWALDYASVLPRLAEQYARLRRVVAVCRENLRLLRSHFGLRGGQVIHYGRPAEFFAPPNAQARQRIRQSLQLGEDRVMVLTLAALEARKGYLHQLKAIRELPELAFAWAGMGTLEVQLREAAHDLPVHFLGHRQDIADLLDACDMVVLPSEFEGMPLCVLEAMARGKPVLASAVSGLPEALGKAGQLLSDPRLWPQRTVREMVQILGQWAAQPELRASLGKLARERACRKFRSQRMEREYLQLLEEILAP